MKKRALICGVGGQDDMKAFLRLMIKANGAKLGNYK